MPADQINSTSQFARLSKQLHTVANLPSPLLMMNFRRRETKMIALKIYHSRAETAPLLSIQTALRLVDESIMSASLGLCRQSYAAADSPANPSDISNSSPGFH